MTSACSKTAPLAFVKHFLSSSAQHPACCAPYTLHNPPLHCPHLHLLCRPAQFQGGKPQILGVPLVLSLPRSLLPVSQDHADIVQMPATKTNAYSKEFEVCGGLRL